MPHISVCICTYRRPALLARLLSELSTQETADRFTYSVVVADNDARQSAAPVVAASAAAAPNLSIVYCVEPTQNIALARNKAIAESAGDFIAFIDDDEFPTQTWLLTLFEAYERFGADGVLGPVKPHFDEAPPRWVVDGKFYDRPSYPSGFVIDWRKGRTGNVLLHRRVFDAMEALFLPEFLTSEDQDFFRRAIAKGFRFVWCHEAMAYETVPPVRWNRRFMVKRALLRGTVSLRHQTSRAPLVAKSAVAVPLYAAALPFVLFTGQGRFMTCLIKLCDHLGRLLALVRLNPVAETYVTGA